MNPQKAFKLVAVNAIVLGGVLISSDLILGKYFFLSPAIDIPESKVNMKKVFVTSSLYRSNNKTRAVYSRDKDGYRPYEKNPRNNGIVLTIGGSTTDQLWVDDSETWQRILETKTGRTVINGGVDGQSTFGHVYSLRNWHRKSLDREKVDDIIFYIGVNDVRFSKGLDSAYGNVFDSPTLKRRLHSFLSRRSFWYDKYKEAKKRFDMLRRPKVKRPDVSDQIGHGVKNPTFLDQSIASNIPLSTHDEIQGYKGLFKELLAASNKYFPKARIHIVQQQNPKCLISGESVHVRQSPEEYPTIMDWCSGLASIYQLQENIIGLSKRTNIFLVKMFEDDPVPDHGFYDGIHTNSLGSRIIGEYLARKIKL